MIAVIGILAAVVLISLGNARKQGSGASVQGNLDTIRAQAEVYASTHGDSYNPGMSVPNSPDNATVAAAGSACGGGITADQGMWGDPIIQQALIGASKNAGTPASNFVGATTNAILCVWSPAGANTAVYWLVAVPLKSDPTKVWCVDNSGNSESASFSFYFNTLNNSAGKTKCP